MRSKIYFKEKLLARTWSQKAYYDEAREAGLKGFSGNKGLKKLKKYARKAGMILDCGCGSSSILEKIWHSKGNFYGVDISPVGIELSKGWLRGKKNVRLLVGDLEKLKFKDDFFDLVYTACVLEHLSRPEKVIEEMIRVTKKDGYLIFIAPNYGSPISHSPSSPPKGETLTSRAIKQFIKSHFYLIKKPKNLDWPKVEPICLKRGEYRSDWDTVVEPYSQTLAYFLERKGLKIVEFENLLTKGAKEVGPPNLKQKLLRVAKKIVKRLMKLAISPYKYYGPDLFLIGKK